MALRWRRSLATKRALSPARGVFRRSQMDRCSWLGEARRPRGCWRAKDSQATRDGRAGKRSRCPHQRSTRACAEATRELFPVPTTELFMAAKAVLCGRAFPSVRRNTPFRLRRSRFKFDGFRWHVSSPSHHQRYCHFSGFEMTRCRQIPQPGTVRDRASRSQFPTCRLGVCAPLLAGR